MYCIFVYTFVCACLFVCVFVCGFVCMNVRFLVHVYAFYIIDYGTVKANLLKIVLSKIKNTNFTSQMFCEY